MEGEPSLGCWWDECLDSFEQLFWLDLTALLLAKAPAWPLAGFSVRAGIWVGHLMINHVSWIWTSTWNSENFEDWVIWSQAILSHRRTRTESWTLAHKVQFSRLCSCRSWQRTKWRQGEVWNEPHSVVPDHHRQVRVARVVRQLVTGSQSRFFSVQTYRWSCSWWSWLRTNLPQGEGRKGPHGIGVHPPCSVSPPSRWERCHNVTLFLLLCDHKASNPIDIEDKIGQDWDKMGQDWDKTRSVLDLKVHKFLDLAALALEWLEDFQPAASRFFPF